MNDTTENITTTAAFMASMGVKAVELLPYQNHIIRRTEFMV